MNKKYFFYRLAILMMGVILFSACRERVTDVTIVTGISLNDKELSLIPGETIQLLAVIYPEDADNKQVTWKSSNPAVATVNDNGLVTALNKGEATITVTTKDGNKTTSCAVNVDYRNKWVGSYDFTIKYASSLYGDTTYSYSSSITKSIFYSNKILVDWGNDTLVTLNGVTYTQKSELTVDTNGVLTYPEYGGYSGYFLYNTSYSYINGDTIRFGISASSLGFSRCWEVIGLKIKYL